MNRDQLLNMTLTDLSFKELLALLKRRIWVIIGTTLVFLALGAAFSLMTRQTWKASSMVLVEGKTQSNPAISGSVVDSITSTDVDYDVPTQIQIMQSFDILYNSLKRINYPLPERITQEEYDKFPKVSVAQLQTTNNVLISVEHWEQAQTQQLAQALSQEYSSYIQQIQKDDVKRSYDFITARIEEERKSQQTQQQELATWKQSHDVTDTRTEVEVRSGALSDAERRLSDAEADVEASEAAMNEASARLSTTPKTIDNPTVVTPIDVIARNQETLNTMIAQRDALLVSNYPDSDRVQRAEAQIKAQRAVLADMKQNSKVQAPSVVRNPLLDEYEKSLSGSKANHLAAKARRDQLGKLVSEKRSQLRALAPIQSEQQIKETRIGETQNTIEKLLEIQNAIRLKDNSLPNPVRDLTGQPTALLVRPIWPLNLALAGLVGLVLGTIFALARDLALDRVNTTNEAAALSGKSILGRIPLRASGRGALIADPSRARAFEAYRILRNSILLAKPETKAFLVTSSIGKEGKTTVAGNLAVAMALEGKRTILVDGNLRNPAVHKLFKVDRLKGASEVLQGTLSLSEALKTTDTPNLAILTAGAEAPNPTELVASSAMANLINDLKSQADIILVDSPSAFGFADTQSLIAAVPEVLYVTELEAATKTQMTEGTSMIDFARGHVVGLIVNKDKLAATRTRGNA